MKYYLVRKCTRIFLYIHTLAYVEISSSLVFFPGANVTNKLTYLVLCYPVRPTILTPPQDTAVGEGRTTSFTCLTVGIPPPTVQWFVGTQRVGEGSVLTITDVDSSMAGTYTCGASNAAASATASAILVVFGG